jgi:hypothetical protein
MATQLVLINLFEHGGANTNPTCVGVVETGEDSQQR